MDDADGDGISLWIPCNQIRMQKKTCLMLCCVPNNTPFPSNAKAKIPTTGEKKMNEKLIFECARRITSPNFKRTSKNRTEFHPFFFGVGNSNCRRSDSSGLFRIELLLPSLQTWSASKIIITIMEILIVISMVFFFSAGTNLCPKFDTFCYVFNFRQIEGVIVSFWAIRCASEVW